MLGISKNATHLNKKGIPTPSQSRGFTNAKQTFDKQEITPQIKEEYNLTETMYNELYENGGLAFHLKFMYPQTITNRRLRYLVDT